MGITRQALYVGHRHTGSGTSAKERSTDIDGVRSMIDGFDAHFRIACRGKEFDLSHFLRGMASMRA